MGIQGRRLSAFLALARYLHGNLQSGCHFHPCSTPEEAGCQGLRGWLRALTRRGTTKIKPKESGPESQLISSLSFVAWHWVKYIAGNQSYPSEGKKLVFYLCRSNNLYPKCLGQRCLFGTLRQPLTA